MANVKISQLPAITSPTTADLVPVVQSGVTDQITRGNFLKNVDADGTTSDVTTNNVTSSKHGYAPKSPADATKFLNGAATPAFAQVKGSDLSMSDVTTNNVSSTAHGFVPKSPADATQFLNGAATPAFAQVKDSDLSTSDITTNNVSTSKHGFAPKAPNDSTKFLDGTGAWSVPAGGSTSDICAIEVVIGDGVNVIGTGVAGDLEVPFACTINRVTLLADQSGSIVIDIWKDTYANYPPTVADTITASAKPTLSAAAKYQDATLTGWTTSISAGDTLRFNVDSASTVTRVVLSLKVTR